MKKILSMLLALMMVFSTVSSALPAVVDISDAVNEFISEAYAEEEAELSDDEWTHPTYGTKLFNMDFETNNDGGAVTADVLTGIDNGRLNTSSTAGIPVSSVGQINPDISAEEYANYRVNLYDSLGVTYSLDTVDDKQALSFIATGSYKPSLYIGGFYDKTGPYTIVIDYKYADGSSGVAHNNIQFASPTAAYYDGSLSAGDWTTVPYTLEYTDSDTYNNQRIVFYCNGSTDTFTGSERFIIDNVAVYYYDANIDYSEPEDTEPVIKWTHETYGTKLFNMDFETNNDGGAVTADVLTGIDNGRLNTSSTAGIPVSSVGQINPDISAEEYANYRVNLYDSLGVTYSLDTVDDKQALSFIATGSYKPSLYIGGFYDKTGPYTIVIDYKYADGSSGVAHNNIQFASPTAAYYDGSLSAGDWTTVPYTLEYTDSDTYNNQRIVFYCNGSTDTFTGSERFIIDNVAVYYYDANIDYSEPEDTEPTDEWTHETYGTKLYEANFDTKIDGTAVTASDLTGIDSGRLDQDLTSGILISSIGKVNPNIDAAYSENYRISVKDLTYSLGTSDGRTYLDIKSTSSKPCFMLGGFNDKDGEYTMVFNYKYAANGSSIVHDRFNMHTHSYDIDTSLLSYGDWVSVPYTFSTLDGGVYDYDYMRCVFFSNGNTFTGVEEFMLDSVSVYYREPEAKRVTVTLDANGNEGMSNVTVSNVADGTKVYELVANVSNKSDKLFLGLSKTADGETLSAGEALTLTEDTTLYMKWGGSVSTESKTWIDDEKGYLLYDIDFETNETYFKNYDKPVSSFGSVNTSIAGSDSWHLSGHYYVDEIPGTGTDSYEPLELDIKSELVDGVYNKYLVVRPDGTSRWPQLTICAYAAGSTTYGVFGGRNGTYTIEGDIRVIKADGSTYSYTSQVVDMGTYDSTTGAYTMTQTSAYGETSVVGEWATMSGVCDDKSYDGIARVKPCNQYTAVPTSGADEIHFDNLKLYWKPHTVAVTFDNSANSLLSNQTVYVSAEEAITVADLKKLVKGSGLKTLKGISQIKGGVLLDDATVISIYDDLTFYTVWEDKDMTGWTDEDHGVLVYEIDFDSAESFTSGDLASVHGRVNPNYSDSTGWTITGSYFSEITLEDDGTGNKYLKAVVGDTNQYPQVQVSAENTDSFVFTSGGVYTLVADVKVASSDNFATNTTFKQFTMPLNAATNTDGTWSKTQTSSVWTSNDKTTLSNWTTAYGTFDATNYDGISKAIYCLGYTAAPIADKETLYLDNLRLFWKPDKVVLTINPGENKVARTHSFAVSTNGVTVSEVMAKIVDHGDMILKGLSYTKNGEPLTGTLTLSSDTTLYALWEETGEVLSEYSVEFEYDESSGTDIFWTNHGTNSPGNSYVRSADGYGKLVFNTSAEHSFAWDSNIKLTTLVSNNIPAGTVKGIMLRMRYQNIPHFDCSCATDVNTHSAEYATGKTGTFSNKSQMFQIYYATTETASLNEAQSVKKTISVADGAGIEDDWFTIYFDVSANSDFQNVDLDEIRIDFNNSMWTGIEVDIDYIRFIGDKSKAPKTQSTSAIKTSKPVGVRFMASLKNDIGATAYGWVIAREVSLESAGIANSQFTYDTASNNSVAVLKGYNYSNVSEKLVYDEDSVNVYFAAMLYNIPVNMYEDVLVARPFAEVDGEVYYGSPIARSIYEVALSLKKGGFKGCTAAQQTYIQRVIDTVEKA